MGYPFGHRPFERGTDRPSRQAGNSSEDCSRTINKYATMTFTLGFSPCPNDTFIFDALVNKKIDTEGLDFDLHLEDVETLNQWGLQGKLDISKISYGVLPLLLSQYQLLDAGGALGKGVGPLLIARESMPLT